MDFKKINVTLSFPIVLFLMLLSVICVSYSSYLFIFNHIDRITSLIISLPFLLFFNYVYTISKSNKTYFKYMKIFSISFLIIYASIFLIHLFMLL
jgi:hypothetical protein